MEFKITIIGMGIMGKNVARALSRNPMVKISAFADINEKALQDAKAEFGVENTYKDYEKMITEEKPDAAFIATPDWAHCRPVMACLEQGIHVHVEKPLTTEEREAADIVSKVKETGLKLQVSYNHRWLAPYFATYEMVREGKIGDPIMGYARKNDQITVPTKTLVSWSKHSSPMWFLSGHDIDLMSWWFDDDPVEAFGYGINRVLGPKYGMDKTYDAIQGIVKYSRGGFVTFESTWIYPAKHPARPDSFMEIVGEHGHIHVNRKAEAIEMSTPEGLAWPRTFLNYKVFDRWVGAFPSCINSFIDDLADDREPVVTAHHGWRATAVLDAVHRSIKSGKIIKISEPPK